MTAAICPLHFPPFKSHAHTLTIVALTTLLLSIINTAKIFIGIFPAPWIVYEVFRATRPHPHSSHNELGE